MTMWHLWSDQNRAPSLVLLLVTLIHYSLVYLRNIFNMKTYNCTFVSNALMTQKEKSFSHGQLLNTQETVMCGACVQPTSGTCLEHLCASLSCLRHCPPVSASASLGLKEMTTGYRTHVLWLPQVFCGAGKEAEDNNSHHLGVGSDAALSLGSVSRAGSFVGTSVPLVAGRGCAASQWPWPTLIKVPPFSGTCTLH